MKNKAFKHKENEENKGDKNTVRLLGQHLPFSHVRVCDEGYGGEGGIVGAFSY